MIGGLYLAGHSSKALDQYVNAAKQHLEMGECSNPEDSVPVKQQKMMTDDVVFRERESIGVHAPTEDPLVITIPIGPATVHKVLVDNGSSVNILFKKAFDQMNLEIKDLKPCQGWIRGFNGASTAPMGYVELPVTLGEGERQRVRILPFVVLDVESPYNAFLGRPALAKFRACIAPWCLLLKFPTEAGIGIVRGDQVAARACYVAELKLLRNGGDIETKGTPPPLGAETL